VLLTVTLYYGLCIYVVAVSVGVGVGVDITVAFGAYVVEYVGVINQRLGCWHVYC